MKARTIMKAFTVALLLSSSAIAQVEISGKIVNDRGKPIAGATISVVGENLGTLSEESGRYQLKNVPEKDSIQLRTSIFGYEEEIKTVSTSQNQVVDFTLFPAVYMQEGVDVKGVRATKKTPTTFTNVDAAEIKAKNYGQDIPILLATTPSTVSTSDAGAGVGYTSFRIRGTDPTRTNVTINGVPINDSESQNLFWVNLPDFASSVESIQVQRGVGTSANGGAAFGASINIESNQLKKDPYAVLDNSFGSFNTLKNTVSAGTGLIANKFSFDTRLSSIISDGYIDRASSNLKSYYVTGAYHGKKSTLRLNVFSGKERTYQAWYGTPEEKLYGSTADLENYADENGLDPEDRENLFNSGRTYNAYTYDGQTDNYQQSHYQLHYNYRFNRFWNLKTALHFTRGEGYFENYKKDRDIALYDLDPLTVNGENITHVDLINQDALDNYFGGGIFYVNYNNHKGLDLILGGGLSKYHGKHFHRLVWAEHLTPEQKEKQYFYNTATKYDGNVYLKAMYDWKGFTFFGDMQYRFIDYSFVGIDENQGEIIDLPQQQIYHFFNPKAGLSYQIADQHSVYASYAIASREPIRSDFRENTKEHQVIPEALYDLETGYQWEAKRGFFNAIVYWMSYKNQLIETGEVNDVGAYTHSNVDKSYRLGLELEGGIQIVKSLGLTGNFTISQNKINDFKEYVDSYDENWNPLPQTVIHHGKTDMAFSPDMIGSLAIDYRPIEAVSIQLVNKFVGKQYLDNTSSEARSIAPYYIAHFDVSYTIKDFFFKELTIGGRINNIFNYQYESNGYTFSYLLGNERIHSNFYYPQAGIHLMGRVLIRF